MRVTQSMMTRNMLINMNQNRENMNRLQEAMASGKEITKASDDPVRFSRAARYRSMIAQNEQYRRNINDGMAWSNNYETVMEEFRSLLEEAKALAIQGADNTQSLDTRQILGNRVDGILEAAVSVANGDHVGKAIFAGTMTDLAEPFSYDGTSVTYNGNSGSITRRIAESMNLNINVSGTDLEATGMFTALINLRDALNANDPVNTAVSIGEVDSAIDDVLTLNSRIGLNKNHLEMTETRLNIADSNIMAFLSRTEDADLAEIISKYNAEETAYQAALTTTSQVLNLNILDFLR